MGSFSDYLENELLDHVFGCNTRNFTPPSNIYVALSTADPSENGSGLAEPSGYGYARVLTSAASWTVASSGALDNASAINFPEATGSWGTITHFALYDGLTVGTGNMLGYGTLTIPKSIDNGDTASFAIGALDVSLD